MSGLFEGVRIIEFGLYVSVPYAAELFAHGGADVIKVEPVAGDPTRHNSPLIPGEGKQYIIKARGKRGIPLDLGNEKGRTIAKNLAESADIVLSNMRPGTLERLGLDYESLSVTNPAIIFGEINGFGDRGPRGRRAAIDGAVQAYSGLVVSNRAWDGDHPVGSEAFITDYMAGALLAFGVTAALRHRDMTGKGQRVETTLLQAALAIQHGTANIFHGFDGWKTELVEKMNSGAISFDEAYAERRSMLASDRWFYNIYKTANGYAAVTAVAGHQADLSRIMGLDDEATTPDAQLPDDPRERLKALTARARAAMKRITTEEFVRLCDEAGIPCAPLLTLEQSLLGEQVRANGFAQHFDHKLVGPVTMPAAPVLFSGVRYEAAPDSPAYGEHSLAILEHLGFSEVEVEKLVHQRVVGIDPAGLF